MKKIIGLLIVLSLIVCLTVIGGCKRKGESNMEEQKIVIRGIIGEKTAINPTFDWSNPKKDASFGVAIRDEEGAVASQGNTNTPHFELSDSLDYGKKYMITVTGSEGTVLYESTFETISAPQETSELKDAVITVCEPYKSHMVLQRGKAIEIKGEAPVYTLVTLEFGEQRVYGVADETGAYQVTLAAMKENATPQDLEIRVLKETGITLEDVLVGDVYLVSGQSNIQWNLKDSDYTSADVENAIAHDVRYYSMRTNTSVVPLDTVDDGKWFKIDKKDRGYTYYSAIAFMVGSMLGKELSDKKVPVGVVCAAQGDTNILSWIGKEYYNGSHQDKNIYYNAMIYPLRNAEYNGVIWYQGCNNSSKGIEYKDHLASLFANWRALFKDDKLPFYVVQLPVYDGDAGNNYDFSYVRESQFKACAADDNAYLIATCDGGDPTFIHPTQKRYIAERLTKSILSTRYGADILPEGPTYASHLFEEGKAIITVKNGDGLRANGSIVGFKLAGEDGKYFDATATIEEDKIVVKSDKVADPKYIQYGFSKSPFLNIYNKDGFLMSPFRTDEYNRNIDLLDYSDSPKYETHKDGSEISYEVVTVGEEIGTRITKANDGKTFGSLQLYKWGAIGYDELGMTLSVVGTKSGAKVLFRIVEGSWEIWAYSFTDNFLGKKEFDLSVSDLNCVYGRNDGVIDFQKIMDVEITIEAPREATITILEARFVDVPKGKPTAFTISEGREDGENFIIGYTRSIFADEYEITVSEDGDNYTDPIFQGVTDQTQISFDASGYQKGKTYYVRVVASNEFGKTGAENNGYVTTLESRLLICGFDFTGEAELRKYIDKNMKVHEGLTVTPDDKGVKLVSAGKGWQYFIFLLNPIGLNKDYNTLSFYLDTRGYQGNVIVQLVDQGNYDEPYSYTVNTSMKSSGVFEIPLSSFKKGEDAFDGRDLERIAFNFNDWNKGTVYFDDVALLKK